MAQRIIDAKLEKEIKKSVDKHIKAANKEIETARAKAEKEMDKAKVKAKNEADKAKAKFDDIEGEAIESIKEKPVEWVAGAFVAGLILGKLLSK